jgi:hydroxyethylthiazole kinase-like uncharacterized protein yjeF
MMTELLTAAQMRSLEKAAIDGGSATGLSLMEAAGRGVVSALFETWPDLAGSPSQAVVLCGPGNNGGDGFVVARLLRQWGWDVHVYLLGAPDRLPPDAAANYRRWRAMGDVREIPDRALFEEHPEAGVIVDALFGTGLTRPFEPSPALAVALAGGARARVVAVDMPSGLCADSGRFLWGTEERSGMPRARADLTVTFHAAKRGHFLAEGPEACGKLAVVDIGLRDGGPDAPSAGALLTCVTSDRIAPVGKAPGHKYDHGHALILSGGPGRTGASRLAARAALRVGAGLVSLGVAPAAQMEIAGQITAIMLKRLPDAAALQDLLTDPRYNAICIGPGLGLDARAGALVDVVLQARRPTVLDADALTLLAAEPDRLDKLHPDCVLTPHGGEFARLFPDLDRKLGAIPVSGPAYSRADAVVAAAARAGCTVLLKGPDTLIADPSGTCAVHAAVYERSAPWLATAGSGDVLAGLIAGLIARGVGPYQAAETGAWLHVEAARRFGPGLIAEDLPEMLPGVFRAMGL